MVLVCMVLYHETVSRLTKSLLLRSIFNEEKIEIEVLNHATTVIYIWYVRKEKVEQAKLDLERAGIATAYNFGSTKEAVLEEAYQQMHHLLTV